MRSTRIKQSLWRRRRWNGSSTERFAVAALAGAVFALGMGASVARPAGSDQVTITMLVLAPSQPG
jgi:hypothetical protein